MYNQGIVDLKWFSWVIMLTGILIKKPKFLRNMEKSLFKDKNMQALHISIM